MANIIKLGSFSLNGYLIRQPGTQCYSGHDPLTFQNTVPGSEISWVDTRDLLTTAPKLPWDCNWVMTSGRLGIPVCLLCCQQRRDSEYIPPNVHILKADPNKG